MTNAHDWFVSETKDHTMIIHQNNGLYRHIEFSNNGSSVYKFMLTTWPGYLAVSGDMGCYIFQRIEDMFKFFRQDLNKEFGINPGYWAEKLQTRDKQGSGHEEWDAHAFRKNIKQELKDNSYYGGYDWREVWWDVKGQLGQGHDQDERSDMDSLYEFRHSDYEFSDIFEMGQYKYSNSYLWICWAIVHIIHAYDKAVKT